MSIGKHTVIIQNIHYENHVRFETLSAICIWLQTSLGTMPRYSWACDQTTSLSLPTIIEHALISLYSTKPTLWRSPHLTYLLYTSYFSPKNFILNFVAMSNMLTAYTFCNIAALFSFLKAMPFLPSAFHWH